MVDNCRTYTGFEIVFTGIFLIKDLINYNSIVDYAYFVARKVIVETIIGLDTNVFIMKKGAGLILKTVEIDGDNINRKMALI